MKTDEIEKTEKTASGDYLRMLTCYVIWGFQPLYFHLKPDIDGLFFVDEPHPLGLRAGNGSRMCWADAAEKF